MSYDITIECGENFNDKAEIEGRVVPYLLKNLVTN